MYSKKYKGKCVKKRISKCKDIIKCFDDIMLAYVDKIERDENISEILCNVPLEDFDLSAFSSAIIKSEFYTGTTIIRPEWEKLKKILHSGDTVVFDSVSRMSRNAEEGFSDYQDLFKTNVNLVFIKEPHINTEVYKQSVTKALDIEVSTGNEAIDEYFAGNMELVNRLLMKLA